MPDISQRLTYHKVDVDTGPMCIRLQVTCSILCVYAALYASIRLIFPCRFSSIAPLGSGCLRSTSLLDGPSACGISVVLWCRSKSVNYAAIAAPLMTQYLNYYVLYVFLSAPGE
ncbi:hypothetical protein EDD22DRAFT_362711 [Suillus occidentalis]|nr:hypothetical protein EDD22DRAFT_362711 [Suillus occidentalis]